MGDPAILHGGPWDGRILADPGEGMTICTNDPSAPAGVAGPTLVYLWLWSQRDSEGRRIFRYGGLAAA